MPGPKQWTYVAAIFVWTVLLWCFGIPPVKHVFFCCIFTQWIRLAACQHFSICYANLYQIVLYSRCWLCVRRLCIACSVLMLCPMTQHVAVCHHYWGDRVHCRHADGPAAAHGLCWGSGPHQRRHRPLRCLASRRLKAGDTLLRAEADAGLVLARGGLLAADASTCFDDGRDLGLSGQSL